MGKGTTQTSWRIKGKHHGKRDYTTMGKGATQTSQEKIQG